jgi:hypothetical protein
MTHRPEDFYRRLRGTVRMLSSDAATQVAYLDKSTEQAKYQVMADDITTEFMCWFGHAERLADERLLSHQSLDALTALSQRIGAVDEGSENWTAEALWTSSAWQAIREQARTALAVMDEHDPAGEAKASQ